MGKQLNEVFERDLGICHICGFSVSKRDATLDHLIPLSLLRQGYKYPEGEYGNIISRARNIALAHESCNNKRGSGPIPIESPYYVPLPTEKVPVYRLTPKQFEGRARIKMADCECLCLCKITKYKKMNRLCFDNCIVHIRIYGTTEQKELEEYRRSLRLHD